MIEQIKGRDVVLKERELIRREERNREYLMKLTNIQLLRNYLLEAGRYSSRGLDTDFLGGWEDPTCQLRGHFLGHWLSAAAMHYEETGDDELKAKAAAIVKELALCQKDNGDGWACSIPEKYLDWIARGKEVWAPQYTVHKLFMGLLDVYLILDNEQALEIAEGLAGWFYDWSGKFSEEEFDDILDVETGGMMEVFAQLYQITDNPKYLELANRYYRRRLFEPLLAGKDVLTNMHANTTIPEVLGCARMYEVTGEEKWLDIAKAYWKCAVTDRGAFVTGGQTQGEIWTPMKKLKARLGDKNQEHCTVYNMIRLAEFLFRQTKDPVYMHYIEYNLRNGVMAQTYCGEKLLTYFLPLKAGLKKDWAGEKDSFFCCHGTMVQANAAWNRMIYYQEENDIYVTLYADSEAEFELKRGNVRITQHQDHMNGSVQRSSVNSGSQDVVSAMDAAQNKPNFRKYIFTISASGPVSFALKLRIPDWIKAAAKIYVNQAAQASTVDTSQFVVIDGEWKDGDTVVLMLPVGLSFVPLPDDAVTGAFRYGADVLAGITGEERVLRLETKAPEDELSVDTERQWGDFLTCYRTENQDPGISFKKINEITDEPYQIYFKTKR